MNVTSGRAVRSRFKVGLGGDDHEAAFLSAAAENEIGE